MGIGIDIIEIERFEKFLARFPKAKERLFTANEITYCEQNRRSAQHYAARFAAKESVMKALATRQGVGLRFRDIEITVDQHGKPGVQLHGRAQAHEGKPGMPAITISLSHCRSYAAAVALHEGKRKD